VSGAGPQRCGPVLSSHHLLILKNETLSFREDGHLHVFSIRSAAWMPRICSVLCRSHVAHAAEICPFISF
jgi:hypothetical protein